MKTAKRSMPARGTNSASAISSRGMSPPRSSAPPAERRCSSAAGAGRRRSSAKTKRAKSSYRWKTENTSRNRRRKASPPKRKAALPEVQRKPGLPKPRSRQKQPGLPNQLRRSRNNRLLPHQDALKRKHYGTEISGNRHRGRPCRKRVRLAACKTRDPCQAD